MSPVNANIPLHVRSPQIANPLDIVAGLQRVRQGEQEQQINALQMERAKQQQTAQQQEAQENSQAQQIAKQIRAGDTSVFAQASPEVQSKLEAWYQGRQDRLKKDRQENANLIKSFNYDLTATEAIFHLDDSPEAAALFQKYRDQPEVLRKIVDAFADPEAAVKTREVKTRDAEGRETTQIIEDRPGQTFTSEPVAPKPESEEAYLIGQAAAKYPGRTLKQVPPPEIGKWRGEYAAQTRAPESGTARAGEWILRNGQPMKVREGDLQPGDIPYRAGVSADASMPSEYQTALERSIMSIPAVRRGSVIETANRL